MTKKHISESLISSKNTRQNKIEKETQEALLF